MISGNSIIPDMIASGVREKGNVIEITGETKEGGQMPAFLKKQ